MYVYISYFPLFFYFCISGLKQTDVIQIVDIELAKSRKLHSAISSMISEDNYLCPKCGHKGGKIVEKFSKLSPTFVIQVGRNKYDAFGN